MNMPRLATALLDSDNATVETPATLKLATWNVELPVSARRREAMRAHTDREQADIWVLTETHDGFTPGHAFSHSSAPGRDGLHRPEHRWVTIWSRHPIEALPTTDVERTAAARIRPDSGDPFIVYGTVLPWIGSPWRGHPSAEGVAFREALSVQLDDWMRLRRDYPADELFMLGDLNQDLVSPRSYGSRANRGALEAALERAGLTALTAGDGDPIRRDSSPRACIDHICIRRDSSWRPDPAVRWPDLPAPDRWLSDHFGVSVVLTSVARSRSRSRSASKDPATEASVTSAAMRASTRGASSPKGDTTPSSSTLSSIVATRR